MKYLKTYKLFESEDIDWDKELASYNDLTSGLTSSEKYKKWEEYINNFLRRIASVEYKGGFTVANHHFTEEEMYDMIKGYYRFYDSSISNALFELGDHLGTAQSLWDRGGKLYRLIYANSEEEIDKENLGHHWTISEYEIEYLQDKGWKDMYGEGKAKAFLITVEVEPHNVSVEHVDIQGNPEEKEINIIDDSKLKVVDIKER
jgi:hypothetical protein